MTGKACRTVRTVVEYILADRTTSENYIKGLGKLSSMLELIVDAMASCM